VWFMDRPKSFGEERLRLIRLWEGTCDTAEPSPLNPG